MSSATKGLQVSGNSPIVLAGAALLSTALGLAIVVGGAKAILVLMGLIALVLIARWPFAGLMLTTALLLLSGPAGVVGSMRVAVPITAAKACGALTFASWIANALVRRQRIRVGIEAAPLILFFLWCAVGVFGSPMWEQQWGEWVRLGTLVAFFVLAVNLVDSQERVHRFTMLILFCGVAMSLFAVAQYLIPALQLDPQTAVADVGAGAGGAFRDAESSGSVGAVRVSGTAGHSNWLALIILMIMPLNVYWFQSTKTRLAKALCLGAVGVEILALILTFTRTGFLVGVVILGVLGARRLIRVNPYRVAAVALALVLGWLVLPGAYKERVLTPARYRDSDSVRHRLQLQEAAWEITKEQPIWGVGLGGYGLHIIEMRSEVALIMNWLVDEQDWSPLSIGTHNMYLQLTSETGVVGLVLILLFFGILLRDLRRAEIFYKQAGDSRAAVLAMALQVSVMSFLLCALFLHALQQKIWWMMVALAAVAPLYRVALSEGKKRAAE